MKSLVAIVSCVLLVSFATSAEAVTIDTLSGWNGTRSVQSFGETNTASYGQTFTVGAGETQLNNFTFLINDFLDPDTIDFAAYVMEWDGVDRATGPVLFASAGMTTTNNGGADGFEAFSVDAGGLHLNAGSQYVAFFSASDFFDGALGTGSMASVLTDDYAGGGFVFLNSGSNASQWDSEPWTVNFSGARDLAFTMDFSTPMPEPSAAMLFGIGALIVGATTRRRSA